MIFADMAARLSDIATPTHTGNARGNNVKQCEGGRETVVAAMTARAKRSSAHGANIFDFGHMTEIKQVVGACLREGHFELGRRG